MKNNILSIAAAAITLFSGTAYAQQTKQLQPGDDMPMQNAKMKSATDGSTVAYAKAAGKNGLLVMFSCNTCPFVIKNEGMTKKTIETAKAHGFGVVIVNSNEDKRGGDDSYEAMQQYGKKQGYTVHYLVDENSKLADAYGANRTPEVFLFNSKNKLAYKGGMTDNAANPEGPQTMYISSAMEAIAGGKQPDPSVTKSVGCSIKRKS